MAEAVVRPPLDRAKPRPALRQLLGGCPFGVSQHKLESVHLCMSTRGYRLVGFDLDDTLYLEREYVRSGFRAVADAVGRSAEEREEIFGPLWEGFLAGERGTAFDRLLERKSLGRSWSVAELVSLYREHRPAIVLLEGCRQLLADLTRKGVRIAIITDGVAVSQMKKIEALGLAEWASPIILTATLGRDAGKPNPTGFRAVTDKLGIAPKDCLYVGDNPLKDFRGARDAGWGSARLRMSGQLRCGLEAESGEDRPDMEFNSLAELAEYLR
jgi:putative hydrolase of the HAD superfamily